MRVHFFVCIGALAVPLCVCVDQLVLCACVGMCVYVCVCVQVCVRVCVCVCVPGSTH